MRTVSSTLAAAIAARERVISVRVSVDWDGDGYGGVGTIDDLTPWVQSVSLEQVLDGDLPEQIQLVEGSAVAEATIDLGGGDTIDDRRSAAWYFSRLNVDSPLYGKERLSRPCRIEVGFRTSIGVEYLTLLEGITRALPVSAGAGSATLHVLDHRELLRTRVTLPVIAADVPEVSISGAVVKPGLEATWVISYILAQQGIYASPPPRTGCRLWAPMHGSAYPFIGGATTAKPWTDEVAPTSAYLTDGGAHKAVQFVPGPFLLGTASVQNVALTISSPMADGPLMANGGSARGRVEAWCTFDGFGATTGTQTGVEIKVSATNPETGATTSIRAGMVKLAGGGAQMVLLGPSGTLASGPTITPSAGTWQFVGWAWDLSVGQVKFRLGTFTSTSSSVSSVAWPTTEADPRVDVSTPGGNPKGGLAELQVTAGLALNTPFLNEVAFTPSAVIDRSLLRLDGILNASGADAWTLLSDVAKAEQGSAYFNSGGVFQFAGPTRLASASAQTVQAELTADTSILDLDYDDAIDQVVNSCRVAASPVALRINEAIYVHDQKTGVAPNSQLTLTVPLEGPAVQIRYASVQARGMPDGTGTDLSGSVTIRTGLPDPQTATLTIKNNSSATAWLVDSAGNPALKLIGDWLETTASAAAGDPEIDSDSIALVGEQPLDVSANPWRQRPEDAQALARRIVDDLAQPRPYLTGINIVGDPRLEHGDRVRVLDADGIAVDGHYWISGIRHQISNSGAYTQTISARRARTTALWDSATWNDTNGMWGV